MKLERTGKDDNATRAHMKKPRCGCHDIPIEADIKKKMMMAARQKRSFQFEPAAFRTCIVSDIFYLCLFHPEPFIY